MLNNIEEHKKFLFRQMELHTFQVLSTSGNMFVSVRPVPNEIPEHLTSIQGERNISELVSFPL